MKIDDSLIDRKLNELNPAFTNKYNRNDDVALGTLFADVFKDIARFNPTSNTWMYFDGRLWRQDDRNLFVSALAEQLYRRLSSYLCERKIELLKSDADNKSELEDIEKQLGFVSKMLGNQQGRERVIKVASNKYPVRTEDFDTKSNLFNCLNGTYDFNTGKLHQHCSDDMLSKISNVEFNPNAISLRFKQFVSEVMENDLEKVNFLQKCLGYSISARTDFECFFITYGSTTRNGKGTLNSVMQTMLGDYSGTAVPDTFTSKKFKSQTDAPNDSIASLVGTHYVAVSEPEEQMVLDSAFVKALTGNDKLRVRRLYQSGFDYTASFKIWFNTNSLPQISDETVFDSGRVILIPFNVHFDSKKQDRLLKQKLTTRDSLSGILNWCIEGYNQIFSSGQPSLDMPESIASAVKQYAVQQDRLGEFMTLHMVKNKDGKISMTDIYEKYKNFCVESGYMPLGMSKFREKLKRKISGYGYIDVYAKQYFLFGYEFDNGNPFN